MTFKKVYIKPRTGGRQLLIGDIHGCSLTLKKLIDKLELLKSDQLIILGDLINKGPDSLGVVDYIISLISNGFEIIIVRGNNESMLLKILKKNEMQIERLAIRFGITKMFKKSKWVLKTKYLEFFKSSVFYVESDQFYAVHAGFDYSAPDPFNDTFQMLWMRNFKADKEIQDFKPVIYGHRIYPFTKIKKAVQKHKYGIPLDNGCVLGNEDPDFGRLVCFDFTNNTLITQENIEGEVGIDSKIVY
jgi:serine/threonine protein phosphatase 1